MVKNVEASLKKALYLSLFEVTKYFHKVLQTGNSKQTKAAVNLLFVKKTHHWKPVNLFTA